MKNKDFDIYKYCYDYWNQSKWDTNKLLNIKNAVGIKDDELAIKVIRKYARTYATDVLNISHEKFYDEIEKKKNFYNKYFRLFEILSDVDINDKDRIIEVFNNYKGKIALTKIKDQIADYVLSYRKKEVSLTSDLTKKIEIYKEYKKSISNKGKKKQNENDLEVATTFVSTFIDSEYSNKDKFCEKIKLPIEGFNKYVDLIKKHDNNLYNSYIKKIESESNKEFDLLTSLILTILKRIQENDFDLVDYYLITKHHFKNLNEFDKVCRNVLANKTITKDEYGLIKHFLLKNACFKSDNNLCTDLKPMKVKKIMSTYDEIDTQVDKYGNDIKGSGRVITTEEKEDMIKFLKDNNVPINSKTYAGVKRRFLDGEDLKKKKK